MTATARAPRAARIEPSGHSGTADSLAFDLPAALSAGEPPEARGLTRDGVRMMVSVVESDRIRHAGFRDLPDFLGPGDLLVVNESATINAALAASWEGGDHAGETVAIHLSTPLPGGSATEWVVELREQTAEGTRPLASARAESRLRLSGGARAVLREPYTPGSRADANSERVRLWVAELNLPTGVLEFAERYGYPIRYGYVAGRWPLAMYQTVFARESGSAEMPSAGRPFSPAVLERLERRGVSVAPIVLHTGVASLEFDEPPYPERYEVPQSTAAAVNATRGSGRRVVAVGTTVVRALETVSRPDGRVTAGAGWTDLVVTPARGIYAIDAILTGLHEPRSSHLAMLEAFAGRPHLEAIYRAALDERYLWHEFGDASLILKYEG